MPQVIKSTLRNVHVTEVVYVEDWKVDNQVHRVTVLEEVKTTFQCKSRGATEEPEADDDG